MIAVLVSCNFTYIRALGFVLSCSVAGTLVSIGSIVGSVASFSVAGSGSLGPSLGPSPTSFEPARVGSRSSAGGRNTCGMLLI